MDTNRQTPTIAVANTMGQASQTMRLPPVIAVANTKGGVGKTTLLTEGAGFFASRDVPSLVIDQDQQATTSHYFSCRKTHHTDFADAECITALYLDSYWPDVSKMVHATAVGHCPGGR
jgi:hypothetical protein